MTNAKKYLKDEVNVEDFIKDFRNYLERADIWGIDKANIGIYIQEFMKEKAKPVLTDAERFILKSLREKYKYIGREGMLYIAEQRKDEQHVSQVMFDEYDSAVFQLIEDGDEYEIADLLEE